MRKIIINRKKSIVACANKVSIYTIDKIEKNMIITKEKCVFLGEIKNGDFLETEITENDITIVAAYNNLGVFMVTDYIVVSKGSNEIILNGKTRLNPSKGNPFVFYRND